MRQSGTGYAARRAGDTSARTIRRHGTMAIGRWDPFRSVWTLRDTFDRLVYDNVVRPTSGLLSGGRSYLPVDVIERDGGYVLRATMPGIDPDDVQITLTGTTVTIQGESRREEEQEGQSWIVRERRGASFYRSVTLPAPIDADRAEARYEHGVLTLALPKAQGAQPRQIRLKGSRQPTRDTRTARQPGQPTSEPVSPQTPGLPPAPPADIVDDASQQSF